MTLVCPNENLEFAMRSSIFDLLSSIFNDRLARVIERTMRSIFDLRSSIFDLRSSIFDLLSSIFNDRLARIKGVAFLMLCAAILLAACAENMRNDGRIKPYEP